MSKYTAEELAAAGWTCSARYGDTTPDDTCEVCWDARVRLAIAHPERAGEALGPGWSVYPVGQEAGWSGPRHYIDTGGSHRTELPWSEHYPEHVIWHLPTGLLVQPGAVFNRSDACEEGWEELPPEFDDALQRARLIAAAWQRIEASRQRDPARPYCREPETCNGSCRRDPACNS